MSFWSHTGMVCLAAFLSHAAQGGTAARYADSAAFQASLQPGSSVETFDSMGFGDTGTGSAFLGQGGYPFSAATDSGNLFFGFDALGSLYLSTTSPSVITFSLPNGGVSAIGGFFFGASIEDQFAAGDFVISLSDGTTYNLLSTDLGSTPYLGFLADIGVPFEWMRITSSTGGVYTGVDNVVVGQAVIPEASTYALCLGGLALGFVLWRRRR